MKARDMKPGGFYRANDVPCRFECATNGDNPLIYLGGERSVESSWFLDGSYEVRCDYHGHEFGAEYEDSICIDGWLWDADSGNQTEAGWEYTHGGDIRCPQCKAEGVPHAE